MHDAHDAGQPSAEALLEEIAQQGKDGMTPNAPAFILRRCVGRLREIIEANADYRASCVVGKLRGEPHIRPIEEYRHSLLHEEEASQDLVRRLAAFATAAVECRRIQRINNPVLPSGIKPPRGR
jgi:hypothetical protein